MSKAQETLKEKTAKLLHSKSRQSINLNRFLLVANFAAIFLFVLDPVFHNKLVVRSLEVFFGVLFLVEYSARIWIAPKRLLFVFEIMSLIDLIVIVSLFAPFISGNFAFLRVVRALRILRTYRILRMLKGKRGWFTRHEEIVTSVVNLGVFIFIMTDIVYVTQVEKNPLIVNYIDALYFTLATLTTTGFGDITLRGTSGHVLAILIMVFGITLFVKLAKSILRPERAYYKCPDCGLSRHDFDASHCKHCGHVIKIETEGAM